MRLIQAHMELGNKWAQIAEVLPGRTENSIKNHWNATKRRQVNSARRNYRFPEPSAALKNYIDAVTSPSSPSIQSPASSSLATNGGSSIGSPSEEASEAPATGVMNELSEAAEQPFDFGGGSDSGYGAGGFGSDMEIDGFSVADFDYSNLVGMSIDGYNGEVEGDGTVRAGDGGEEVEGMSWQDILNSQV
ncbi:unnamed protein product [Linum tenue]|uniref:Uncharacterized protein n=1 Tax=Linum tenue TaxID=586396 RepID=A0AAV0LWY3_9ROSI|nr:unnamed protein product [Linum tenue]